jgi:epoxyqueuosine reductase
MELTERLQLAAENAGATGYGVCDVAPFTQVAEDIEQRVAAGMHAGMRFTFGEPATATDIRASFPWAHRLVVVAWSYLPGAGDPGPPQPRTGRVARFAVEDHYRGLRRVLAELAATLHAAGHRAEPIADDNRLVDRGAAVRAGIGWWGKNTMVLAPGAGPWLLLGSVVTDADLPASAPMVRDCGTCDACLPACPTGALVAPGILDARRCLAYWLQGPGLIPYELRRAMGDRVYGCDDCLEACPPGGRLLAGSTARRGRVDLFELLRADDATLLERFGHWYIPRRQARYLRRNALVALGNSGGLDAAAVAAGFLSHPDWLLRAHAAWAVGELGGKMAAGVLAAAAAAETHPEVSDEIELARVVAEAGLR